MTLAQYLKKQSKDICKMDGCTRDEHKCGSYAYINSEYQLMDLCLPDYFQGSSKPYAAISLPWSGSQKDLQNEVDNQIAEMEG